MTDQNGHEGFTMHDYDNDRIRCTFCHHQMRRRDLLTAANPFCPDDYVNGCPKCKNVQCFEWLCDVDGCMNMVSIGTPTKDGYRQTCHIHEPKKETQDA